jgi:hypothetical protein
LRKKIVVVKLMTQVICYQISRINNQVSMIKGRMPIMLISQVPCHQLRLVKEEVQNSRLLRRILQARKQESLIIKVSVLDQI